jgi:hypothetical protein
MADRSSMWRSASRFVMGLPAAIPPPTVPMRGPTVFTDDADQPGSPRRFTEAHAYLLRTLKPGAGATWSATALWACLEHLRVSTVTHAARVSVEEAWTDGPDALCVVYRPPFDEQRVVGVRRQRRDATEPGEWRIGDMTTWGYELGADADATAFGWNVADFDIGEPLGYVATILRTDDVGIQWWGTLGAQLPQRPKPA